MCVMCVCVCDVSSCVMCVCVCVMCPQVCVCVCVCVCVRALYACKSGISDMFLDRPLQTGRGSAALRSSSVLSSLNHSAHPSCGPCTRLQLSQPNHLTLLYQPSSSRSLSRFPALTLYLSLYNSLPLPLSISLCITHSLSLSLSLSLSPPHCCTAFPLPMFR